MNWDDLRIFLAVARIGSLSGAARNLGVQHSTVSRRLQHLETSLGVRLLDKKRTGYELTAAGEDLREAALRMEREVLNVDGTLQGLDANLRGTLRVTTVGNIASSFLMPMLSRFSNAYPEITVELSVSNADVSLPEREADIAIRVTSTPAETLIGKKIGTIASAVYGSHDYLERMHTQNETPKWIGVNCCDYHIKWTRRLSGDESFNFRVDEPLITHESVRQGLGLAVLPCHMGDRDPELRRYMDPPPEMDVDLWLLYHRDLKRTERVHVFRDFIANEFENISDLLEGKLAATQ
ncbi:MAG: LysR family transcriptional regulator [Acidiferrobacterales bacterium]|nr:LysR family transcriptional regulator [Acidiferrobacterales bacterium]